MESRDNGLVDTGCSRTVVSVDKVTATEKKTGPVRVTMMDGSTTTCCNSSTVNVVLDGAEITLDCLVSRLLPGFGILLGMDAVSALGGVHVSQEGRASFGKMEKAGGRWRSRRAILYTTGNLTCSHPNHLQQLMYGVIRDADFENRHTFQE